MANEVYDAIQRATTDPRVQLSMLLGSALEGGWGPRYGVGDSGMSFGPYQIHLPAHPGVSAAQALDPVWATNYMLPRYQAAVAQVPNSLWQSNPEAAAEQAAYLAERPKQIYHLARGQQTVDRAYRAATAVLTGKTPNLLDLVKSGAGKAAGAAGRVVGGAAEAAAEPVVQAVEAARRDVGKFVTTAGFVLVGLALVVLGAYRMAQPQIRRAQDRAAELGGHFVKGAAA